MKTGLIVLVCCSVFWCVAVKLSKTLHCSDTFKNTVPEVLFVLHHVAPRQLVFKCVALQICCSMLQCIVLQRVAACCSVLQRVVASDSAYLIQSRGQGVITRAGCGIKRSHVHSRAQSHGGAFVCWRQRRWRLYMHIAGIYMLKYTCTYVCVSKGVMSTCELNPMDVPFCVGASVNGACVCILRAYACILWVYVRLSIQSPMHTCVCMQHAQVPWTCLCVLPPASMARMYVCAHVDVGVCMQHAHVPRTHKGPCVLPPASIVPLYVCLGIYVCLSIWACVDSCKHT